jgi:hypothetical protein
MENKKLEPLITAINLDKLLRDTEIEFITRALTASNWCILEAANLLGLKRTTLTMRISAYQLQFPKVRPLRAQRPLRPERPKLVSVLVKSTPTQQRPAVETHKYLKLSPNNIEDTLW